MSVSDSQPLKRTTVVLNKDIRVKLKLLKKELGFAIYNALFNYAILELTREGLIPPVEYSAVFEKLGTKPVSQSQDTRARAPRAARKMALRAEMMHPMIRNLSFILFVFFTP